LPSSPAIRSNLPQWLDLKYAKPVHAEEVRIRESCGSGAVIKVEVFDEQGAAHAIWAGNDPTTELNYLIVNPPKPPAKPIASKSPWPPTSFPAGTKSTPFS
jgi:hypothetical protein